MFGDLLTTFASPDTKNNVWVSAVPHGLVIWDGLSGTVVERSGRVMNAFVVLGTNFDSRAGTQTSPTDYDSGRFISACASGITVMGYHTDQLAPSFPIGLPLNLTALALWGSHVLGLSTQPGCCSIWRTALTGSGYTAAFEDPFLIVASVQATTGLAVQRDGSIVILASSNALPDFGSGMWLAKYDQRGNLRQNARVLTTVTSFTSICLDGTTVVGVSNDTDLVYRFSLE